MKIKMIALKATKYAGRRYAVGDFIMARGSKDARVLEAVKIANRAPTVATEQATEPQRAPDITFQHVPVVIIDEPVAEVSDEAPAADAEQEQEAGEPASQEAPESEEVTEKPAVVKRNSRPRGKARSAE